MNLMHTEWALAARSSPQMSGTLEQRQSPTGAPSIKRQQALGGKCLIKKAVELKHMHALV